MKKIFIGILLVVASAEYAAEDCKNQLQMPFGTTVGLSLCTKPFPELGEKLTIKAGDVSIPATVALSKDTMGTRLVEATASRTDILMILDASKATVTYGTTTIDVDVLPPAFAAENKLEYKWSIGPATKGDENGKEDVGALEQPRTARRRQPATTRPVTPAR